MTERQDNFAELEDFFRAGRAARVAPSDALMDRVMAQAAAVQAERAPKGAAPGAAMARAQAAPAESWLRRLVRGIGGGGAVASLLTAAVAGVWLGVAPPAELASLTQNVTLSLLGESSGSDQIDLLPTLDTVLDEN